MCLQGDEKVYSGTSSGVFIAPKRVDSARALYTQLDHVKLEQARLLSIVDGAVDISLRDAADHARAECEEDYDAGTGQVKWRVCGRPRRAISCRVMSCDVM